MQTKRRVGRPAMGVNKQIKLTLPEEDWIEIEKMIANGEVDGYSGYFRQLHQNKNREEEKAVVDKWRSL
ncbi:hypothetical protein [Paenibacillus sp. JCM 10914]|uniref:hypothetical protein n=1 Tax=Paenibacillus sp. JCM 10914 TaxID=1236974 RepID=UPI00056D12C0|nr:hypothetical protein [Paenibacillus sp. JCM 10914]